MSLEKYLFLYKFLLSLFGVKEFKDLQDKLKEIPIDIDSDGRTYFCNVLRSFKEIKISEYFLIKYDQNIQSYVRRINYRRDPINLKYFQYLAILFTEILLDNIKNRKLEFLYELNKFLENYKEDQKINNINLFTGDDLNKIAFWMATGSGKTLIMHINYFQFFKYKLFSPDNILLITPNEGLSKQHFEELQKSGIPCQLYQGSLNGGLKGADEVLVIERTKFVEEKKGGGITLSVDAFEGRNLIFVDEGHKGRRSEEQKWVKLRNMLSKNGFVFEYSATFGQILSENQPEILKEYSKSIVFDYSYKYFYLDGYGKDFSVLNIKYIKTYEKDFQETMFIANLLSFYEQLLVYEELFPLAKEYNIEKPLWIFVGTTVTGKEEESDVIQIVEFINKILSEEEWLGEKIKEILSGRTSFRNERGEDIFKDRFEYIKNRNFEIKDIYKKIFGGKGELYVYELKNAEGEFGLKVGEKEYFGVINIGDVLGFKRQLEKRGININQDVLSSSLFEEIKKENSKVNILIGSKKFIEGWDTWRVSSMGLLNIGRGQGPQIIQLFGRGVRIKGKDFTLKRSNVKDIKILENLNIYGIKADYLSKFLEAISKEEIEFEKIEIPIKTQYKDKGKELYILSKDVKNKFEKNRVLRLEIDDSIFITLDLSPNTTIYQTRERREEGINIENTRLDKKEITLHEYLDLFDWDNIYREIYEFKISRNYWNLIFNSECLKNILLSNNYRILISSETIQIKNIEDLIKIYNLAILVIKKYIDRYYYKFALFDGKI
ncbi:MAG: DEAD/DEAH box helicase family protein [Dictyoglomaceae bacterium]|nr:DEAD/DEAH box helicase family protein [Dictyoglomaceae bacterium]